MTGGSTEKSTVNPPEGKDVPLDGLGLVGLAGRTAAGQQLQGTIYVPQPLLQVFVPAVQLQALQVGLPLGTQESLGLESSQLPLLRVGCGTKVDPGPSSG